MIPSTFISVSIKFSHSKNPVTLIVGLPQRPYDNINDMLNTAKSYISDWYHLTPPYEIIGAEYIGGGFCIV